MNKGTRGLNTVQLLLLLLLLLREFFRQPSDNGGSERNVGEV